MDAKKGFSPTRSDKNIQGLRNEPERQLGSLRDVIEYIRRDGGTPSVESIAMQLSSMHTAQRGICAACASADPWQPVCAAGGDRDSGET